MTENVSRHEHYQPLSEQNEIDVHIPLRSKSK